MAKHPNKTVNGLNVHWDFPNVRDMIAVAETPIASEYWSDKIRASQREDGRAYLNGEFYSSDTFADAAHTLRTGAWDIDRLIDPVLDQVRAKIGTVERKRPRVVNSVSGGTANIGRLVAGDPRSARRIVTVKQATYGRHVTIMTNLTAAWTVKPEQIARRGAALVALVESLNLAGIGVDVYAGIAVNGKDRAKMTAVTKIVDATAGADRITTTYSIGNGDFFRRFIFSIMEHMGVRECQRFTVPGAYGFVTAMPKDVVDRYSPDILIESAMAAPMERDPAEWVMEQLRRLGVVSAGMA